MKFNMIVSSYSRVISSLVVKRLNSASFVTENMVNDSKSERPKVWIEMRAI